MAKSESVDGETCKLNNICRVCMHEGGEFHSIFQKIKEESVAHMITVCANIDVSEHDGLPKQCCKRCIEGMFISFCMRKQCRESDLKLRSMFLSNIDQFIKKEFDPTFETVNLTETADADFIKSEPIDYVETSMYDEIEFSDSSDSNSNDNKSDDSSDSDNDDNDDNDNDDDDDDGEEEDEDEGDSKSRRSKKKSKRSRSKGEEVYVHRCCICRTDFADKEALEQHSIVTHIGEKSNDVAKPFECEVCFRRYFTKSSLKRHKREIQKITGTRCCGCKQDFKTREALQEHTNVVHGPPVKAEDLEIKLKNQMQFVCDVCFTRCATEMALSHHKTRVYLGKTYHCSQCEKSFMRKTTLVSHEKRVHLGSKGNLLCSHCGKSFLDQSTLTNHEKTHVKDKPYECQVCMKTFASRTYLQTHMKLHTDPSENIPCPICDKEFRSTDLLKSHMNNTHNSDNLFECNICLAKFKSVYYLKFHVRTHTGEKPYECEHCKKTFAHKSGYRRHVKTHTGEKPFMCNFCGKSFSNRPNMLLHEKYHTGDKNSACDVCGKTFVHSKYMKRHRQRHFMEKNRPKFEEYSQ